MLCSREITLTFKGHSITRIIKRGCPQGGILSPLLWNITINMLLQDSGLEPKFIQAFADDMVILVTGIDQATITALAKQHLIIIKRWCTNNGLKLSTVKTKIILFKMIGKKIKYNNSKTKEDGKTIKYNTLTIDREEIDYVTSTIFLGVTIDQHLNWTEHITNKCNKAKKLLYACKNIVGKNWGVTPERLRWIYNQIVIPQILYASFIWSHKASDNKKIITILQSVQRLASLMITGAISKTPTAALEVMASIRPIHDMIRITAVKTALRLKANNDWIPHTQTLTKKKAYYHTLPINKDIKMLKDANNNDLIPKTPITNNFKINPFNQTDIENIIKSIPVQVIKIYTDGSLIKSDENRVTGAGIYITQNNRTLQQYALKTNDEASVFQCEMFAILKAAEWINNNCNHQTIYILSDSQASLAALNKHHTKSAMILQTINELNQAQKSNNLNLIKVPAHIGIDGNEKADTLAKLATKQNIVVHKLKASVSSLINELKQNLHKEHIKRLSKSDLSNKAKTPMSEMLMKYKYNIKIPNRKNLMMITQILTSTSILNYSRSIRVKSRSPYCLFCKNIRETSEHFLTKCQKLDNARIQCFGKNNITLKEIINTRSLTNILDYIKDSNRFSRYEKELQNNTG